jgi:hypothetical protein
MARKRREVSAKDGEIQALMRDGQSREKSKEFTEALLSPTYGSPTPMGLRDTRELIIERLRCQSEAA